MKTGFVTDERCFWHDPGNYALMLKPGGYIEPYNRHIENPDPKRRLLNLLNTSGLLSQMETLVSRDATRDELARLHTPGHLAHVQQVAAAGGGELGIGAPISANGWDCAVRSAGCGLAAVEAVMANTVQHAYALTRPPGHHAEPDRSMGFCVFANAALAAQHAITRYGLQRVAIVDWDVHFGNGTHACFEQRSDVLTISVHQQKGYHQVAGEADEIGSGAGRGFSINVPLPPGCGFGAYRDTFERIVVPAVDAFKPELILVACGYDAGRFDPLGRMMLDDVAFRWMTTVVAELARRHAHDRLVLLHEGGYCPVSVPFWGLAAIEELTGIRTDVECPFTAQHDATPAQKLASEQASLIRAMAGHFEQIRQTHW